MLQICILFSNESVQMMVLWGFSSHLASYQLKQVNIWFIRDAGNGNRYSKCCSAGKTQPRQLWAAKTTAFATFVLMDSQLKSLARFSAQEIRDFAASNGTHVDALRGEAETAVKHQHTCPPYSHPLRQASIPRIPASPINPKPPWIMETPLVASPSRDSVMSTASPEFKMSTADLDKTKSNISLGTHAGGSCGASC